MTDDPYLELRKRVQRELEARLGLTASEINTARALRQFERALGLSKGQADDRVALLRILQEQVDDILIDERVRLSEHEQRRMLLMIAGDLLGLGPIDAALDQTNASAVYVMDSRAIYVERGGKLLPAGVSFDDEQQLNKVMRRIFEPMGHWVGETSATASGHLADGSRVEAILSADIAPDGPQIVIRKRPQEPPNITALIEEGMLPQPVADFLQGGLLARRNILITGKAGSGKTRLLAALANNLPAQTRLLTVEAAAELAVERPHLVRLEAGVQHGAAYTTAALLQMAPALLPDRVWLGEVTTDVAAAYIEALTRVDICATLRTRNAGGLSAIGTGPRQALDRLTALILQTQPALSSDVIERQIALGLDIVIVMGEDSSGLSRIAEIALVRQAGGLALESIFEAEQGPTDALTAARKELSADAFTFSRQRASGTSQPGPLTQPLFDSDGALDDSSLDELYIVKGRHAIAARAADSHPSSIELSDAASDLRRFGQLVDDNTLLWAGRHPDGTRLALARSPLAVDGDAVSAERFSVQTEGLKRFVQRGMLTPAAGNVLVGALRAGRGIMLCGPDGSGKRGLLFDLLGLAPESQQIISLGPLPPSLQGKSNIAHAQNATSEGLSQIGADRLVSDRLTATTLALLLATSGQSSPTVVVDCGQTVDPFDAISLWQALWSQDGQSVESHSIASHYSLLVRMGRIGNRQRMLLSIEEVSVMGDSHSLTPLFRARPTEQGGLALAQVAHASFQ